MAGSLIDELRVGTSQFLACGSSDNRYVAAFEDDGQTGYFYGCIATPNGPSKFQIIDALHIYNVASVTDKERASTLEVSWADNPPHRVGLFINGYCHAVYDFDLKRAGCRTGFPPADRRFTQSHAWDDSLMEGLIQRRPR